jgi:outer membrane receptor protein involved in Fe transport
MPVAPPEGGLDPDRDSREEFEQSFPSRTDLAVGAYLQAEWQPAPRISLTPGLRFDLFTSDGAWAASVDPRISAAFQVGDSWTLTHTFGLAHQPQSFVIPLPGFQMGGLRGGLQRSVQHSAGVTRKLPDDMRISATLFHNQFYRLSDLLSLVRSVDGDDLSIDTRTRGRSYGLELLFRRDLTRKLGGFLSYTLSRSDRFTPGGRIVAAFDRPHVLNAALGYDLGRRWRAGGRFVYYSGAPADEQGLNEDEDFQGAPFPVGGPITSVELVRDPRPARLPAFYRLDMRVEKRWLVGDRGSSISFVFEVQNVTLNQEVIGLNCSSESTIEPSGRQVIRQRCDEESIGPVTIPSIGVEGTF